VAHPFERVKKEVRRFLNKTMFKKQLQARRRLKREQMVQEGRDTLTRVLDNADADARQEILAIMKKYYPDFTYFKGQGG
jgi:short-subunit dehydrogenase involved in D-alanine esterification of teichoic acids